MSDGIEARVTGIPDLRQDLLSVAPKLRVRALRNALAVGARIVQRAARAATPVLSAASVMVRKGWRTSGLVKKQISVRTSKVARRAGDVGVFVNVRPAKTAVRGAKSPSDPFYWRFVNFGTKARTAGERSTGAVRGKLKVRVHRKTTGATRAARFLEAGAARLPDALQAFLQSIKPAIEKLNKPKAPPP